MRASNITGVLSIDQFLAMTEEERKLARAAGYLPPIAGGSSGSAPGGGEGEGGGAGSGGEGSGSGGGEGSGSGEDEEHDDSENDEDEDEDDNDREGDRGGRGRGNGRDNNDDDLMELKRSEYERLKRIAREKDRDEKNREKREAKEREKRQREAGQYEDLLKEKDEKIVSTEAERDEARYQLDAFKRQVRVSEAAKRLGFKDPEDAFRYLSDEDTEDDATTERALKALSKRKAYLVNERKSTGAPVNGDGVTLTMEQIQRMSPEEINSRWDEVQKAMASAGS